MPIDLTALRAAVYEEIINTGLVPESATLGRVFGVGAAEVRAALASLRIGKTILVHPVTGEIWMAGPFSASETAYRVVSAGRAWWANCAWDMFGVPMITGEPAEIQTHCGDCGERMRIAADPGRSPNDDAIVHFLVPARHWYDDIGFT